MAQVALSEAAARDFERLILTHSLPADAPERLLARLAPLQRFPEMGPALDHPREQYRYVLGPWRWMVVVYEHLDDEDLVLVTAIEDGRSRRAPVSESGR